MKIEENISDGLKEYLNKDNKSPFTDDGFDAYIQNVSAYIVMIFNLSTFFSKQQGVKEISKIHIQKASESLFKARNDKFLNLTISIAGLLLGASISHLATLAMNNNPYDLGSVLFIVISGFVGSLLIGLYLAK